MDNELQKAALQAMLREHFACFVAKAFLTVDSGQRFSWNWHIAAIAWHLQAVAQGRIKRLLITVPPRHLKSICASVALPPWMLGHDPTCNIICASYAQDFSVKLHNHCRSVMNAPWYRAAFPRTRLSARKNTEGEFETTLGGGRLATSVEGVLTGRGGNLIIIDDPIKPRDAASDTMRERVNEWYRSTVFSRLNERKAGAIIVVMQRLHVDDLAGHLLEQGDWTHLNLPAIAEVEERIQIGPGRYHPRRVGDLLHPERESRQELDELKRTLGTAAFSAQYQQRPVPLGGGLIRWDWFRCYEAEPERERSDEVVQSWDTASKAGQLNDYSVCTTWLVRDKAYHLIDLHRERLEFPALKRRVRELADLHRPDAILIEDKGSGTQLIQDLEWDGQPCIGITPEGDKVVRAHAQTARIEAGQVRLPASAPWLDDFKHEVLGFPNGRHDDQVDSMVQFLTWAAEREYGVPRIRVI
jgi:predicted phage terminase large subunit-like protein